jgi:hypothetical protein
VAKDPGLLGKAPLPEDLRGALGITGETNVFQLSQPGTFADPLTEVLRNGVRALLSQAVEAEVAALLGCHADKLTDDGRQRLVRHGHLPEREIMTGIGPVPVRCPRVRDRVGEGSERIRFSSAILPPYARRSKSLEVLIPILYLKGVSTGDFEEALAALLGKDAGGLSASTIGRLKDAWSDEHVRWSKRDLSAKRYVYLWADGIHVQARLEDEAQCLLVIIGATPEGKKELVGLIDGVRERAPRPTAWTSDGTTMRSPQCACCPTAASPRALLTARSGCGTWRAGPRPPAWKGIRIGSPRCACCPTAASPRALRTTRSGCGMWHAAPRPPASNNARPCWFQRGPDHELCRRRPSRWPG